MFTLTKHFVFLTTYSLLAFVLVTFVAKAESPPKMPLPPCTVVNGVEQGACPNVSADVSATLPGIFTANTILPVKIVPTLGVCFEHHGFAPYPWSPSPCYSAVHRPVVLGCGYIDLSDGETWRETSCTSALFQSPGDAILPMFVVTPSPGSSGCGGFGDFQTYANGGPANREPSVTWGDIGPTRLGCNIIFSGPRPDGLYGPTWVKLRVGIDKAENGDNRRGFPEYTEVYVPIDGDMRSSVDVKVQANHVVRGSGDDLTVILGATLTNNGAQKAESFDLSIQLPEQLHFQSISDNRCEPRQNFVGGTVHCLGLSLAEKGHPLGRDVEIIEVVTRVINASDLEDPVEIIAKVADDFDPTNNDDRTYPRPILKQGSSSDTLKEMERLAPYFNYETREELLDSQCDYYMNDIYGRLESIKRDNPRIFENLSFGRVTSGDYSWAGGTGSGNKLTRAGHVGVVVYLKGTNYHETGIIIHGTPTWSPTDLDPNSYMGTNNNGDHISLNIFREGTADHGLYYRTLLNNFPGSPEPENPLGCGFEGLYYLSNANEFNGNANPICIQPEVLSTCALYPDAVRIRTESPVDINITNSKGQRVQTESSLISIQELDSGIHSFGTPHKDGKTGWTIVLPIDDYDIDLLGTGNGPYKLTMTKFNKLGDVFETVMEGTAEPGKVEKFKFQAQSQPTALLGIWDIDGNGKADPLTDGLLVLRYLFGFTGDGLVTSAVDTNTGKRDNATDITDYLKRGKESGEFDIDGNGKTEPLLDGLLLIRYLFGFRDDTLIDNAVDSTGSRTTATEIQGYIKDRLP